MVETSKTCTCQGVLDFVGWHWTEGSLEPGPTTTSRHYRCRPCRANWDYYPVRQEWRRLHEVYPLATPEDVRIAWEALIDASAVAPAQEPLK